MSYIYKIINDINDKVYIGKTEFSIEKRFNEHCHDCYRRDKENRPLYSAMKKYGIQHFKIILIEETNNPIEREKYWIKEYNSYKDGYNATIGGDGKSYIDYKQVIELYNRLQNQAEVARTLNISVDSVHNILIEKNIKLFSGGEVAQKAFSKPVAQLDKNTKEIIKIFSSCKEAEKAIGIHGHIEQCCNGKRKTCGGYCWKFIDSPLA